MFSRETVDVIILATEITPGSLKKCCILRTEKHSPPREAVCYTLTASVLNLLRNFVLFLMTSRQINETRNY